MLENSFFFPPFPAIQAVGDVNRSTAPCLTLDEPEEVYPQEHLPTVAKMNAHALATEAPSDWPAAQLLNIPHLVFPLLLLPHSPFCGLLKITAMVICLS